MAAAGLKYHAVGEADLSAVAQTLAAGGQGVAIVSDDARFPIVAAWDGAHFAAPMIEHWARRLAEFTAERYAGSLAPSGDDTPLRMPALESPR